ncbi:MAG: universal stress protein [Candidatus Pelagadaptatus aseana]|uniref:universal stress protein n=1 Tax=Candidatus Pelagadaptatus aseana TaxID=3120508 RepID=UPI0039B2C650
MNHYTHILVGLDLTDDSEEVLERATALTKDCNAKLTLAHIIEPLTFAYGGDIPVDLTEIQMQLEIQAKETLSSIAKVLAAEVAGQHVIIGQPVDEMHQLAEQIGADLIIVGSHGRKGLALLLGSTANGVIHGAKCDVLAVRVALKS